MSTPAKPLLQKSIDDLTELLAKQLEEYRKLMRVIDEKTQAVRHARIDAVPELFQREKVILQRAQQHEQRRLELIHAITGIVRPNAGELLRLREVAEAHPDEDARARLLVIAEQLRTVAVDVQRRSSRVRAAAEALARHMSGVMQTVRSALSRAGVYEHQGRLAVGAQLEFSVDIRS